MKYSHFLILLIYILSIQITNAQKFTHAHYDSTSNELVLPSIRLENGSKVSAKLGLPNENISTFTLNTISTLEVSEDSPNDALFYNNTLSIPALQIGNEWYAGIFEVVSQSPDFSFKLLDYSKRKSVINQSDIKEAKWDRVNIYSNPGEIDNIDFFPTKNLLITGEYQSYDFGRSWFHSPNYGFETMDKSKTVLFTDYYSVIYGFVRYGMRMSKDYGASWQELDVPRYDPISSYAADFSESEILYLLYKDSFSGKYQLNFSDDAGANQSTHHVFDFEFIWSELVLDPTRSDILYIMTGNKFLKGTDYGRTWETLADTSGETLIKVNPYDSNNIFIFHGGYLSYLSESTDGGKTFDVILEDVGKLEISPTDPNNMFYYNNKKVYRSTDGGDNWDIVIHSDSSFINNLIILPNESENIYIATKEGLYLSDDMGETLMLRSDSLNNIRINDAIYSNQLDGILYYTNRGLILNSNNSNEEQYSNLEGSYTLLKSQLMAVTANKLIIASIGGIVEFSINNKIINTEPTIVSSGGRNFDIHLDPAGNNGYYVAQKTDNDGFEENFIFFKNDTGTRKITVDVASASTEIYYISVNPKEENEIIVSAFTNLREEKIYRSMNKGETWEDISNNFLGNTVVLDVFHTNTGDLFLISYSQKLMRFDESSEMWVDGNQGISENSHINIVDVGSSTDRSIFLGTSSGEVYCSINDGRSWLLFSKFEGNSIRTIFRQEDSVVVVFENSVYRTEKTCEEVNHEQQ